MRLYFKPGELLLEFKEDAYVLSMEGQEIRRFTTPKLGSAAFNKIRQRLEKELPPSTITPEQRQESLRRFLADQLIEHNSFKAPDNKSASKKTRTFG
jgi:hypothetical protein